MIHRQGTLVDNGKTRRCPNCAAVNRLAAGRTAVTAKCGTCRRALFNGHPIDADAEMFRRQTSRSDIPVLIDLWAPWCGPCRMMAPAYQEAARILEPEIRLVKLNSEANQEIASTLGIRGIPTLILFSGGRELARVSGAMSAGQIVDWTRTHLRGVQ